MCILLKELHRGDLDLIVIICASIVLFGLVVMRMVDLVRQQERSVVRERLLSSLRRRAGGLRHARGDAAVRARGGRLALLERPGAAVLCRRRQDGALRRSALSDDAGWPARTLADAGGRGPARARRSTAPLRSVTLRAGAARRARPAAGVDQRARAAPCRSAAASLAAAWSRCPSPLRARCGRRWRRWPPSSRSRWRARA